jgi:hypothetical protein
MPKNGKCVDFDDKDMFETVSFQKIQLTFRNNQSKTLTSIAQVHQKNVQLHCFHKREENRFFTNSNFDLSYGVGEKLSTYAINY